MKTFINPCIGWREKRQMPPEAIYIINLEFNIAFWSEKKTYYN